MNPIIFYQTGGPGVVAEAVRCLRRFVPNERIWVITDDCYVPDVRRYDVAVCDSAFGDIDRLYVAVSGQSNPPEFEKTCIKRWFAIRHVMDAIGVDRAFCADSDTLICCDPFTSPHITPLTNVALTRCNLVGMVSANITLQSRKSIASFCHFVLERLAGLPGASDMALWDLWVEKHVDEMWNLNTVIDGQVWDHNIAMTAGGYAKSPQNDCKDLLVDGGLPYARKNGEKVRMLSIHCWNGFKDMMASLNYLMESTL